MQFTATMHVARSWIWEAEHANIWSALVREPGGPWQFMFNVRLFRDNKIGTDSKDHRATHKVDLRATEHDVAVANCEKMLAALAARILGSKVRKSCIQVDGDVGKFLKLLKQHPSMHITFGAEKAAPEVNTAPVKGVQ